MLGRVVVLLVLVVAVCEGKRYRCKSMGMFMDKDDCNKYWWCFRGSSRAGGGTRMACPSTLYFNDKLQVCDWPSNVRCKADDPKPKPTPKPEPKPDPACVDEWPQQCHARGICGDIEIANMFCKQTCKKC